MIPSKNKIEILLKLFYIEYAGHKWVKSDTVPKTILALDFHLFIECTFVRKKVMSSSITSHFI